MKTWHWFGHETIARPGREHAMNWLSRFIELMSRGEIPVDGIEVPEKKAEAPRNPEPVRWGNFR
jgi:hypothetical protein